MIIRLIILSLFLSGAVFSRAPLMESWKSLEFHDGAEVLYLPSGKALKGIAFGYEPVLADILWFNTINYFGKQYRSDQNYEWLKHMCGLVIELDPKATHTYEFCSAMLGWEASNPDAALVILNKAVAAHPQNWLFLYLRGFNYMFFQQNQALAQKDFIDAAQLPDADPIVARLAAKKMTELQEPEVAVDFLIDMIEKAEDNSQQKALTERLKDVWFELGFKWNKETVTAFKKIIGSNPESLKAIIENSAHQARVTDPLGGNYFLILYKGQVEGSPATLDDFLKAGAFKLVIEDPYGGLFRLNGETGKIESSSKKKRLTQFRKSPIQIQMEKAESQKLESKAQVKK